MFAGLRLKSLCGVCLNDILPRVKAEGFLTMRCLVTGGAGFIGSHLCLALMDEGHDVVAIDNMSVSKDNVSLLEENGVEIINADINENEIEWCYVGVDVVFHLAAMNRAQRSIENPVAAHHANITGTLQVLEAMRKYKVPKIIFASSSSVYEGGADLLKETDALAPLHPYGVGKLASEHYVRVYGLLHGIKWITLRLFSVYGERQLGNIDKAGVVAKYIHLAQQGKPLPVYGDGLQTRNFTYVGDVVRAFLLAMEADFSGVLNIAAHKEITVLDIAKLVSLATTTNVAIEHLPELQGDPKKNAADTRRAKYVLGYEARIGFPIGVLRTVRGDKDE